MGGASGGGVGSLTPGTWPGLASHQDHNCSKSRIKRYKDKGCQSSAVVCFWFDWKWLVFIQHFLLRDPSTRYLYFPSFKLRFIEIGRAERWNFHSKTVKGFYDGCSQPWMQSFSESRDRWICSLVLMWQDRLDLIYLCWCFDCQGWERGRGKWCDREKGVFRWL